MRSALALVVMAFSVGCIELRPYREAMFFAPGGKGRLAAAKTMTVRLSSSNEETSTVTQDDDAQARATVTPGVATSSVSGSLTRHHVGSAAEAELLRGRIEECMIRIGNRAVQSGPADVTVEINLGALRLGSRYFAGWVTDRIRLEWRDGQTGELLASQEGHGTVTPFLAETTVDWMLAAYCH